MQGGIFSYVLLAALATALLIAACTDLRRREIDNWLNIAIAVGAPLFWLAAGFSLLDVGFQLAIAAATFGVLVTLFIFGAMGGGDVKLLTALSLWIEPISYLKLIIIMAMIGGVLTLIFGGLHLLHRKQGKVAVPYGIAISTAGLWVLASQYIPFLQPVGQVG